MIKWNLVKTHQWHEDWWSGKEGKQLSVRGWRELPGRMFARQQHAFSGSWMMLGSLCIQVIDCRSERRLCLGPRGPRKGFRATEDKCLYRSSCSSGVAEESSVVFGCVRGISSRNHKLSCLHSPRYRCPSLEKTMKRSIHTQIKYGTGLGKAFQLLRQGYNTDGEQEAKQSARTSSLHVCSWGSFRRQGSVKVPCAQGICAV